MDSADDFLAEAQRSGLIPPEDGPRLTQEITSTGSATRQEIAEKLVERRVLTRYQADQLLAGKGDECILTRRYRILERLGVGGTGAVYKAFDDKLDRVVAIKVMAPQHVSNLDSLSIGSPSRQAGITLEVSRRATIEATDQQGVALVLHVVPSVTVRGFAFRSTGEQQTLVMVKGACAGLKLKDLSLGATAGHDGIAFLGVDLPQDAPPIIVERCRLLPSKFGISLMGLEFDLATSAPCTRIVIRNNLVVNPSGYGILLRGESRQIHVVRNRNTGPAQFAAIQLDMMTDKTEDILIANNTVFEAVPSFRVWDDAVRGKNIRVCNNLILGAAAMDMQILDRRAGNISYAAPSDGALVAGSWRFDQNWRETKKPAQPPRSAKAWIPPLKTDVLADRIEVVSRESGNPNFLQPIKGSPLAKSGAGTLDPRPQSYVRAVPPEGVAPWDWNRTWRMLKMAPLLTVSTDPNDGGEYRTINDALKAARPWTAIRILDAATYARSSHSVNQVGTPASL